MYLEPQRKTYLKFKALFDKAPWLKESKNILHMPISGMKVEEAVSWKELYEFINAKMDRIARNEKP